MCIWYNDGVIGAWDCVTILTPSLVYHAMEMMYLVFLQLSLQKNADSGRYIIVARLKICDLGVYLSGGVGAAR